MFWYHIIICYTTVHWWYDAVIWCFDRESICSSSGECGCSRRDRNLGVFLGRVGLTAGFLEKDPVVTEDGRHDDHDDDDVHLSGLFCVPHIIMIIISITIRFHHHHHHHPSGLVGVILNETSLYYESGEGQYCITRPLVMKLWMTLLIRLSLPLSHLTYHDHHRQEGCQPKHGEWWLWGGWWWS